MSATRPITSPDRAPARLDGLQVGRALAALTVVIGHAVNHAYGHATPDVWQLGARYGVTLFFVISGFIMVQTTGAGAFEGRRFLSRRIRRVVPIYVIANLIVAFMAIVAPTVFKRTIFEWHHFILSLLFIPAYDPAGTGQIWPLFRLGWTLNYEMFFYVVFALCFALSAMWRAAALTVFFVGLIVLGQLVSFQAAIPAFYTRIETLGFVVGVWLGILQLRRALIAPAALVAALFVASSAVLGYIMFNYSALREVFSTQLWLVGICAAHVALLLMVIDLRGWKVPRALLFVGDASYSMYLFHMFAIGVMTALIRRLPELPEPLMVGVSAASGIAIGLLAYQFVERPLNRIMRGKRPLTAEQIGDPASTAPPAARPKAS